mmetsp:Transcript_41492/g.95891  ORF Transcript_41492/g.95891 Transcript_41492/m.95891 type:complete len:852 (+) Transcript_41492:1204-3759(+)
MPTSCLRTTPSRTTCATVCGSGARLSRRRTNWRRRNGIYSSHRRSLTRTCKMQWPTRWPMAKKDISDEDKVRFTEIFRVAVREGHEAIIGCKSALKRAKEQAEFLSKARKEEMKEEMKKATESLKGFAKIKKKFVFGAAQAKDARLSMMSKNERILCEAEEKELNKLNFFVKSLYKQMDFYSKDRLGDVDMGGFMMPPLVRNFLNVLTVVLIAAFQIYTMLFSITMNICASSCDKCDFEWCMDPDNNEYWQGCDQGRAVDLARTADRCGPWREPGDDCPRGDDWSYEYSPCKGREGVDWYVKEEKISDPVFGWMGATKVVKEPVCHPLDDHSIFQIGDKVRYNENYTSWQSSSFESFLGFAKDKYTGQNNTYTALNTMCSYNMCDGGEEIGVAWFTGVCVALAITLVVSQPASMLAMKGVVPIFTRKLLRANGNFAARVMEQAQKIHAESEENDAEEAEKAAKKRDKRLKKEYKRKKKIKKNVVAVEVDGPEEQDDEGAAEFKEMMKEEERKEEEKAQETKVEEATVVESVEVVQEAPKRMPVEEIAAQTLVLDEHEFIAARLEDAAAREAQQAALEADMGIGVEALRQKLAASDSWAEHQPSPSKEPAGIEQETPELTIVETIAPSKTTMAVTNMPASSPAPVALVPAVAEPTPAVPAIVEMWTCPATGETMPMSERAHYLANCVEYRDCWQAVLAALVEKLGKAEVETRVSKLYQTGLCSAEEAFCSLGECGGDVDICMEKLRSEAYREEMQLACQACNLKQYVSAKRKKRKKKKRPQDGGKEDGTKERRRKKKTPAAEVREAAAAEKEKASEEAASALRRVPPPPTGPPPTGTGEGANRYRAEKLVDE